MEEDAPKEKVGTLAAEVADSTSSSLQEVWSASSIDMPHTGHSSSCCDAAGAGGSVALVLSAEAPKLKLTLAAIGGVELEGLIAKGEDDAITAGLSESRPKDILEGLDEPSALEELLRLKEEVEAKDIGAGLGDLLFTSSFPPNKNDGLPRMSSAVLRSAS